MSTFGSPGGRQNFSKPSPPERGSFPLDHEGECKSFMTDYLKCIRKSRGVNQDDCRMLSKAYLQCRMDRNLMAPDSMKNLGYAESSPGNETSQKQQELKAFAESTRDQAKHQADLRNEKSA